MLAGQEGSPWRWRGLFCDMTETHPPSLTHGRAWATAMTAFLVHNVEEVIGDLPSWAASQSLLPWLGWMAGSGPFVISVGVLTLAVGGIALFAMTTAPRWSRAALVVFAVVMLGNAAGHIALSLWTSTLMPGAVTAAIVVAPVFVGVLLAAPKRRSAP
jgi:hypothetical protein